MKTHAKSIRLCFSLCFLLAVNLFFSHPLPADASLNEPAPEHLTWSSPESPLSFSPLLEWDRNTQAVAYEIEFLTMRQRIFRTMKFLRMPSFARRRSIPTHTIRPWRPLPESCSAFLRFIGVCAPLA